MSSITRARPRIGRYAIDGQLALAPMAGVTDLPFRNLCRAFGANIAAGEMLTSNAALWGSAKSRNRMCHDDEIAPRIVQIVGGDPKTMADAARMNVDRGAQIIDINMGCPAKKVCNKAAGSALLREPELVAAILEAVTHAVDVPVTLKMRTGWDPMHRNGTEIARLAEACGIQSLAIHGRTRACMFTGNAEYETIRTIKAAVKIPVWANGDIDSAQKARQVLDYTGADGVMIGRAAQGRPWIFRQIAQFLATGNLPPPPDIDEVRGIMRGHLRSLYQYYGEDTGVRIARKHIGWYAEKHPKQEVFRRAVMQAVSPDTQLTAVEAYFDALATAA